MQKQYVVKIQRAMPWFYIGQVVSTTEISKWYTPEAISLLMTDGFLSTVSEVIPPKKQTQKYIESKTIDYQMLDHREVLNKKIVEIYLHKDSDCDELQFILEDGKQIEIILHDSGIVHVQSD